MFKGHHSNVAFFDIKLKSHHRDILVIKGNEYECDYIPLEGNIKLSIKEDMHVKRIKLNLIGEYNLRYFERANGIISDLIIEHLCVLRIDWDNLLCDSEGKIIFGNYGDTFVGFNKLDSLKKHPPSREGSETPPTPTQERPSYARAKSQPILNTGSSSSLIRIPKSGVDGTPFSRAKASSSSSFLLPKGNYNLPFKVVLPSNISESVEGLKRGQLSYKFCCSIERGRFEKTIHKWKHIRICRTVHPRSMILTDAVDVESSWPGKIQYKIDIPKKGLAVGSTVPIRLLIIPFIKGLSLKSINGEIVEHFGFVHLNGRTPEFEEIIGSQKMPIPSPENLSTDLWDIKTHFKVPNSLTVITQSCVLKNSIIQVRHRLRLLIQIKNSNGNVSELRANLPVTIYISTHIGNVRGKYFEIDPSNGSYVPDIYKDIELFRKDQKEPQPRSPGLSDEEEEGTEIDENFNPDDDDPAPPLYQQHVFDQLYDLLSPQSPNASLGTSLNTSPIGSSLPSALNLTGYFDAIPNNIDSYFDLPKSTASPIDVNTLSKVPSYDQAVNEDEDDEELSTELAPKYDDDDDVKDFRGSSLPTSPMGPTTPTSLSLAGLVQKPPKPKRNLSFAGSTGRKKSIQNQEEVNNIKSHSSPHLHFKLSSFTKHKSKKKADNT